MRNAIALVASLAVACAGTRLDVTSPDYVPCGSTICLVGSHEVHTPLAESFMMSGPRTEERHIQLRDVNAATFSLVGNGWATDGRNVWCGRPSPVTTADRFHSLGGGYYDANGEVWEGCEQFITGEPPDYNRVRAESFHSLGCGLYRLGHQIYSVAGPAPDGYRHLAPVTMPDSATFRVSQEDCTAQDAQHSYKVERGYITVTSAGALPCGYARVGNMIFFGVNAMPDADAATFEVLTPDDCVTAFARDARHPYRFMTPLEGIDAKSFRVAGYLLFADRNHVYRDALPHYLTTCNDADPATYMSFRMKRCPHSPLFSDYGRDAVHIFYRCTLLRDADPATFEVMAAEACPDFGRYARDAKSVWFDGRIIPGADAATFKVGVRDRASDKFQNYLNGRP